MPTPDELRRQAEELAQQDAVSVPEDLAALAPAAIRQTLHDLRVHQTELEMQNEELRRAQGELEAARERYFDLYDLAPVGYVTLSESGLILEGNLTAATLLGVARGVLVKRAFAQFIHSEDQELYYRHRQQLLATAVPAAAGKTTECELRLRRRDGTAFWARLDATVAPAADGTRVSRITLHDISGRKQAEEALRTLAAELEQRVEERTAALRGSEAKFRALAKDLAARQEQLRILSLRLSGAQEDERRRIAQGLHDKLGQALVAVQLKLAVLRQTATAAPERATLADEIDQLLRDATKEIRELVFELNSPTLQRVGVEDAVEELCEHMEATLGVHFEVQWDKRRRPVAEGLRAVLYRAAHELLLNVAKHAGVARATVRLGGRPGHIRIAVVDRGRGFDAAQVGVTVCRTGGFGLYSIRERLQSVGGTFRVTSAPGKGTQAVIEAPVAAEE